MNEPRRASSVKHRARAGAAYTLLEICMVMFIIALIVGAGVPAISGISREAKLREPQRRLQLLATTARRLAVTEGRPYEIQLDEGSFHLRPVPVLTATNQTASATELSYQLSKSVKFRLQRLDSREWRKPEADHWIFSPSGLCEQLKVQFSSDQSVLQLSFSPLTATVNEETCSIR